MATLTRTVFEQIAASAEFRRLREMEYVLTLLRRADVKAAMQATFTNLQGLDAQGRPKYEKFLRTIEKTYISELDAKIRSYGP